MRAASGSDPSCLSRKASRSRRLFWSLPRTPTSLLWQGDPPERSSRSGAASGYCRLSDANAKGRMIGSSVWPKKGPQLRAGERRAALHAARSATVPPENPIRAEDLGRRESENHSPRSRGGSDYRNRLRLPSASGCSPSFGLHRSEPIAQGFLEARSGADCSKHDEARGVFRTVVGARCAR